MWVACLPPPAHAHTDSIHNLSNIETLYPEHWVVELLTYPLRVAFFLPDANGSIHHGEHRFSAIPHSLTVSQYQQLSKRISSVDGYHAGSPEKATMLHPVVMLRFENEQQTIDFVIDRNFQAFRCYINQEFHAKASSPAVEFHPDLAGWIRHFFSEVFPETSNR